MNTSTDSTPNELRVPAWQFALRLVWVVVQLLLVYWLGESGAQFFYQGF
ncbi:MAG TPA: hypothetical protein VHC22_04985 [Pirellulales bacterium]|nr:hypothetical protein [Pirellulales bacterium]